MVKAGRISRTTAGAMLALGLGPTAALAVGVSPYIPLNLEPEMEHQVERVLILADQPILKRPIATATVLRALPAACEIDAELCARVRAYLEGYMDDYGITHASVSAAKTRGDDEVVLPNQHGLTSKDSWSASFEAFWQPSDYILGQVGGVGYSGRVVPTGTVISIGVGQAQLDIGWRDHWMSPMTDSAMLPSTEAPTMPGVTLSNFEPITPLKISYEFFLDRMSKSDNIIYNGVLSSGHPKLAGFHFSIEPVTGWSFGINRVLQYGGGVGMPSSAHFLLSDFFKPSGANQFNGNQQASYVSRFVYPGKTPFAVYVEYAGEDNSNGGSYLLGNAALAAGIDFPKFLNRFDATLEMSEWQNIWYVHNIYLDGMSNDNIVLGNWGAQMRNFGDGVGARSMMARIGWEMRNGGYFEERFRTVKNQGYYGGDFRTYQTIYAPFPYHREYEFDINYSRPWGIYTAGGGVVVGKDVYGKRFSRLDGFLRLGSGGGHGGGGGYDDEEDDRKGGAPKGTEIFVDGGLNSSSMKVNVEPNLPITKVKAKTGEHFAIGARRAVSESNDLGARLEIDKVDSHTLVGVRMVDFRHRVNDQFALSAFMGAARYGLATPALSVYAGVGAQIRDVRPGWDIDVDYKYAQNVARDHVLASDVQGPRPETFYKITTISAYLSKRF